MKKNVFKEKSPTLVADRIKPLLLSACLVISTMIYAQEKNDEFKPSGKVWGYAFGDFYYKLGGATAAGTDSFNVSKGDTAIKVKRWGDSEYSQKAKDYYAFSFRRIYLGYDYNFTKNVSSRILLEGSDGVITAGGDRTVFFKALYLEWKDIIKNQKLVVGQFSTPTWSTFTEPAWSYRSVEKTITDFRKIGRSNDVGIGLSGTLLDFKSTSADTASRPKSKFQISYNLMYANGRGSKPEDNNRMKVYYGELIFKILNSILLEGYAEYEPNSTMYLSGEKAGQQMNTGKTLIKEFVGYQHDLFTIGIEALQATAKNAKLAIPVDSATSAKKDTIDLEQMGLSLWARGQIIKDKLYAFARYDIFNNDNNRRGWEYQNKNSDVKKYDETFIVAGIDWRPVKNVQVMPNIWMNSYKDMTDNVPDYKKLKRENDLVARMTIFFKF